jgi:hypothetical protein
MFNRIIILVISIAAIAALGVFVRYWVSIKPIWIVDGKVEESVLEKLPPSNRDIIAFIEDSGRHIAPNYEDIVCTEFVTAVLDKFASLTVEEKRAIAIITEDDLGFLVANDSPIIRGVQRALSINNKGIALVNPEEVKPGDFVQFWNEYRGKQHGHCGVVLAVNPNKTLTVFSSHSLTKGYGKQMYLWPDKVYFTRLK